MIAPTNMINDTVYVNVHHIVYIWPISNAQKGSVQTQVELSNGDFLNVMETPSEVLKRVSAVRK